MTKRREFTKGQKAAMVLRATNDNGLVCCEGCGLVLGKKPYEFDHSIPEGLRTEEDKQKPITIDEGKLLGKECCHRGPDGKTNKDVKVIAKAKRVEAKYYGIKPKRSTLQGRNFDPAPPQNTATRPLSKTARHFP